MRRSVYIRFLLVFALLFAQMGGLVHGISHAMAEHNQSLPHEKPCDLCETYAQLSTALGSHAVSFGLLTLGTEQNDGHYSLTHVSAAFTAFSARAPPYSA